MQFSVLLLLFSIATASAQQLQTPRPSTGLALDSNIETATVILPANPAVQTDAIPSLMSTPATDTDSGLASTAMHLNTASALLGRPVVGMLRGAGAPPPQKGETVVGAKQTPRYWSTSRKIESAAVTLFHMADAAQTCWHESNDANWREHNPLTPGSCAGASVVLIGSGPLLQWTSYLLIRRYPNSRVWAIVDHGIPHLEMSVSFDSIRCSNTGNGCGKYGF